MGKTTVLGLGNLLLGDEGVGIHAVRALASQETDLPDDVELVDGGTAALGLLPIFKDAERVIVVDAVRAGGEPGSVYRFTLDDMGDGGREDISLSLHQVSLGEVARAARLLNIAPAIIIGIEPRTCQPGLELSPVVQDALPRAVAAVRIELNAVRENLKSSQLGSA